MTQYTHATRLATAFFIAAAGLPALADPLAAESMPDYRAYLVAGGIVEHNLIAIGYEAHSVKSQGYHFGIGRHLTNNVAVEFDYSMLDTFKEHLASGNEIDVAAQLYEVAGLFKLPRPRVSPYTRIAYVASDLSVFNGEAGGYYHADEQDGLMWGLGVDLTVSPAGAIRIDYTKGWISGDEEDLGRLTLGLVLMR